MNYTELKDNIQEVTENTFTDDQLAMFVQQAEQKIYNTVQIPSLRKNVVGELTVGVKYLGMPTDFLWAYSLAVMDDNGDYHYLLNKDVNFIHEAYPNFAARGLPKHYSYFDAKSFIVGPTPDAAYQMELHYGYYPESITTAGTTWLGDEFDSALLNGALIEAIRFMKGEPDVVQMYERLYVQSLKLLKMLGDGRLREDTYRSGQPKTAIE